MRAGSVSRRSTAARLAEHFARSGAGQQQRTILFENRIGPTYFRAIAKIAFHGALRLRPAFSGNEWEFDVLPALNPAWRSPNDEPDSGPGTTESSRASVMTSC